MTEHKGLSSPTTSERVATTQNETTPAQNPACDNTRQAGVGHLAMRQYATPANRLNGTDTQLPATATFIGGGSR